MRETIVPSFYLYGEPHRAVADGFVHVEQLDDRSRPSAWTIQPHAHAELAQLFVIDRGGGTFRVEDVGLPFAAPAVLIVPAAVVHGFTWNTESAGSVLTLARSYLATLEQRYPGIDRLFARSRVLRRGTDGGATIAAAIAALMRELGWAAPGHRAAVDAALLAIIVAALRSLDADDACDVPAPGQQAALVARFRARVDERFRLREPVADHAAALGVGESRLRAACARMAATSPAAMLDARAMLEARRALLYSNLSVAEIGYAIGFADPAYFTRFFTRHAGQSPRLFRRARA
ncbi:helix-turn-helix domain-containing protein [Sphingomonas montana]|uniref:helix-turn-helix domain-containing protein n=1 Tax=Sphingomonas montana TaxID=1843236 RepID=UPI00096FCF3B|nr:helix-turn-helix domain-containing protein [Sphingomonas montana]